MTATALLVSPNCLALSRRSLHQLRASLERDTGLQTAAYLQEAGFAGGEAVYQAYRGWLAGRYGIEGGMSTTGALTRWFRDQFGQAELAAETKGGANAYVALADLAAQIPAGSQGLICLPYLSGERTPINDPLARGIFAGITLSHTRAHMYRAALEATAYGVRDNLDVMAEMGAEPKRIVAVGGGTQNPLWLQIVSDVTGKAQIVPERTIGASYGDAFLAGVATGIIPDRNSINRDWVKVARTIEPDPKMAAIYEPYHRIYKSLYQSTRDDMHRLAELGQAAGID